MMLLLVINGYAVWRRMQDSTEGVAKSYITFCGNGGREMNCEDGGRYKKCSRCTRASFVTHAGFKPATF